MAGTAEDTRLTPDLQKHIWADSIMYTYTHISTYVYPMPRHTVTYKQIHKTGTEKDKQPKEKPWESSSTLFQRRKICGWPTNTANKK